MAFTSLGAFSFTPGAALPALGHQAARATLPSMLLDAGAFSLLADAPVLLPDAAATAAPVAAAVAEEPGAFDLYAVAHAMPPAATHTKNASANNTRTRSHALAVAARAASS